VLQGYKRENNITKLETFTDIRPQLRNSGKFFGPEGVKHVTVYVPQPS